MASQLPAKTDEKPIIYVPLGEQTEIRLTVNMVRAYLCVPTKSGQLPDDSDVFKFLMLCRARALNPWTGDAFLVGYDSKDGPSFSLITSHQALLKRAECAEAFDGIESGVIVAARGGGQPQFREGEFYLPDAEDLLGAWARAYRKDRAKPFYNTVNLRPYNSGRSRWAKDPGGMIRKVAEGSVLRRAFPSQTSGLYTREEMSSVVDEQPARQAAATEAELVERLKTRRAREILKEELPKPEPQADLNGQLEELERQRDLWPTEFAEEGETDERDQQEEQAAGTEDHGPTRL